MLDLFYMLKIINSYQVSVNTKSTIGWGFCHMLNYGISQPQLTAAAQMVHILKENIYKYININGRRK